MRVVFAPPAVVASISCASFSTTPAPSTEEPTPADSGTKPVVDSGAGDSGVADSGVIDSGGVDSGVIDSCDGLLKTGSAKDHYDDVSLRCCQDL